jgi:RimJ/RimL family protein N-acetyltransferase
MTVLEPCRQDSIPVLVTERLLLRPPRKADARAITRLVNDRRIAENTAVIPHPYALADAHEFIARAEEQEPKTSFLITLAGGRLIGGCAVAMHQGRDPEIGYWIGVPYWGCGYATEAARALVDHAFETLHCERLASGARVSNPASRRVLEKCGFQWSGAALLRTRSLNASVPIDRFRLDRGLWDSLKRWGAPTRAERAPP